MFNILTIFLLLIYCIYKTNLSKIVFLILTIELIRHYSWSKIGELNNKLMSKKNHITILYLIVILEGIPTIYPTIHEKYFIKTI